ncbi:MAG: HD domain-containing protein [Candidatus Daviesbacteria bacterium]|nr:HD domain-containing protein [Candidatus Daviesbacteria bacterium]
MITNGLVKKAYDFTSLSLTGKKRYSGDSFEDHGIQVSKILQDLDVNDTTTLVVAILHHAVLDGAATYSDVEAEFGSEVTSMLKTIEDLRVIKLTKTNQEQYAENLRKMFLYLAKDLRIVLIKLADVLDNLRTLQYVPKYRQKDVAKQALEIFAPLAERLGIGELKGQMQDLAFPIINSTEYIKTKKLLKNTETQLNKRSKKIKSTVFKIMKDEKISFSIESREKHLYSLYMKLKRPEINFDISKVYDLIAFRVVVENIEDCYKVLGIIHGIWKPVPERLRDYIASPKPNGYRSIHTVVFGPNTEPFEIQIRTREMHEDAEYGIAAHWHYDESKSSLGSEEQLNKGLIMNKEKLTWVLNLRNWQEEITDNKEFLKTIKTDFFGPRIFVLTPKGDIKDLPQGATPIDFAYAIHTHLGDKAVGAKVNHKLVSLDRKLKSGDMVEILASRDRHKKPSRDWLNFVVTTYARKKIKYSLSK